jgi:hypothetical protein
VRDPLAKGTFAHDSRMRLVWWNETMSSFHSLPLFFGVAGFTGFFASGSFHNTAFIFL